MSSDWEEISIDDLKADKNNAIAMGPFGSRIKKENFTDSGIPVIKGGNLNGDFILEDDFDYLTIDKADELSTSNAFRRDIVITHRGTIGQVGIIPDNSKHERYVVSQSQLKVSLDESRVNSYFVYYFLRAPIGQHRLLSNASQVGVPAIAQASTSVKSILVPVPKIEVQDKIVEILLSLDHKIEANKQINETLEAMAQAIFKSWFVDFDPVRAKIEAKSVGRDPNRAAMAAIAGVSLEMDWDEVESALDQKLSSMTEEQHQQLIRTAELFPGELVESEIGEVPKGWEVNSFKEICEDIQSGGTPKRSEPEYWGEGYPWLSSGEIRNRYLLSSEEQITEKGLTESNAKLWPSGSTIIAMYGATAGVTAYLAKEMCANQACCCLIPADNSVFVFISALRASRELSGKSTGSAQQNLNKGIIERHKILVPSDDIIEAFERIASHLIEKIISNEEQNDSLSELRDTLLPKLISGEVGV